MKLDLKNYEVKTSEIKDMKGEFINRELSFLEFNKRVLDCALNESTPLNEAFKFLSITESNLDEFISVRFGDAFRLKKAKSKDQSGDKVPFKKILNGILDFKSEQDKAYLKLITKNKLKLKKVSDLGKKDLDHLYEYYMDCIFPILTPIILQNFRTPTINASELCIAVQLEEEDDLMVIPIPKDIDLVTTIDDNIILTEDIIIKFMAKTLFINKTIKSHGCFRVVRDASFILSHDMRKSIVDRMNDILAERSYADMIFLDISKDTSESLESLLINSLHVPEDHCYKSSQILYYKRFANPMFSEKYSYKPFTPFDYSSRNDNASMFDELDEDDVLLHHPYDTYDTVVDFINEAAHDDKVVAIKQTLYRVSSIDSPIVNALCYAAQSGKNVSVLVEIKARFDEANNIALIDKLKQYGVNVILGMEYLKTHCKMCIVIRKDTNNNLHIYSHLATGNYNEKTSKIYVDLSYLTSKKKVGIDLLHIFNILSGHSSPDEKMQKIFYAPITLRKNLIKCIDREIKYAKDGKPAEIIMKVNAISDKSMVNKLYEAADKGVSVYIICRGICSIVPRKNLYIKSIVGRFLEHSRIYYFKNGKDPEYYISSADLLTRNLDKRVETLVSLTESSVIKQIRWILQVYRQDESNSFEMTKDGKWIRKKGDFSSFDWFIKNSDERKVKKKWKDF